jgi:hypothetical protein
MALEVHLGGNLPQSESANGLEPLKKHILDHPDDILFAVVTLEVNGINDKRKKGTVEPTMSIRHIEVTTGPTDEGAARKLMEKLFTKRTGQVGGLPNPDIEATAAELDINADE